MSFLMRIHKCPHVEIFNMLCSLFKYYLHVSMAVVIDFFVRNHLMKQNNTFKRLITRINFSK